MLWKYCEILLHPSKFFRKTYVYATKQQQQQQQKQPLSETVLSLVKKCVSIKQLQQVHTQMLVNSIHKPNFLLSKTIGLKHFSYASLFFSHIPQPNDYAFNVMICGLTTTWLKYSLALDFYYCMKFLGLKPNNFFIPFYVHCVRQTFVINHGRVAHSSVFKVWLLHSH